MRGADLLEALEGVRQVRAPYEQVLAAAVGDLLRIHRPPADLPIVEIGAGTGQLRQWIPETERHRTLHTDVSRPALDVLRSSAPGARMVVASADRLPFRDGECGGVLGLCVFDTLLAVAAEGGAVDELGRVLARGGRFVHVLDLATLLDRPFADFHEQGLVPVPNVFSNPGDHEWPLDVVLFEREWLSQLLQFGLRLEHPLVTAFGPYFAAHLLSPFNLAEAINQFKAVATSSVVQRGLARQMAGLIQMAVQQGHPARPAIPFHSGKYLSAAMERTFRARGLFEVELSQLVTRSMWQPVTNGEPAHYRSLCLGHQRTGASFPNRLLAPSSPGEPHAGGIPAGRKLVEVGIFAFVARRL